jgi:MerR family transcriptional regulator/heat shock protein HspR
MAAQIFSFSLCPSKASLVTLPHCSGRMYMARKKPQLKPIRKDTPLYPIGVAAKLLDVHPRTLRIYEDDGLIRPERVGNRRLYSENDLTWIGCLRRLIHDEGISIPGIKKLLRYATCYEIADCPPEVHCNCDAVVDRAVAKTLHLAGDNVQQKEAKAQDVAIRKQREQREWDRIVGKTNMKKRK